MRPISRMNRNSQISSPVSNSSQSELIGRDWRYDKETSSEEAFEFLVEPTGFDRWSITKNNREGSFRATSHHRKNQNHYAGTDEGDSDSSYLSEGSEIAIDMLAHWDCKGTRKKNQNPLLQPQAESLSNNQCGSPEGKLINELDTARLKKCMLSRPTIRSEIEVQDMVNLIKPSVPVFSGSVTVMNRDKGNSNSRAELHLEKAENDELMQFMPTESSETHI